MDTVELLVDRSSQLRTSTKELVATLTFQATKANEPLLQAPGILKELNETGRRAIPQQAPADFVNGKWEPSVVKDETIDRHAYGLCVLSELRHG